MAKNIDINHKDIERAMMAQDVAQEMNDLVNDELSADNENHNIVQYICNNQQSAERLTQRLSDSERQGEIIGHFSDLTTAGKISHLNAKMKKTQYARRVKLFKQGVASVAAAVIFVSLLFYILDQNPTENIILTQIGDINEFSQITKPTIITENGEKLELEQIAKSTASSHYLVESLKKRVEYKDQSDIVASQEERFNELVIPPHHTYSIVLADGSEVTLNAGSKLRYPINFVGDTRTVELSGEAFFKVTKSDKPFIVKAEQMNIKVYGTRFNVNVLSDKIETVLVDGKVALSTKEGHENKMEPNQLFIFNKASRNFTSQNVDAQEYIKWIEGDFDYRERSLKDVLSDIARWYSIEFENRMDIDNMKISLYSPREVTLEDILDLIEMSKDLKFIKEKEGRYRIERR